MALLFQDLHTEKRLSSLLRSLDTIPPRWPNVITLFTIRELALPLLNELGIQRCKGRKVLETVTFEELVASITSGISLGPKATGTWLGSPAGDLSTRLSDSVVTFLVFVLVLGGPSLAVET